MGTPGPEKTPGYNPGSSRRELYPVGSGVVNRVLGSLKTSEDYSRLASKEMVQVQENNSAIIGFLKTYFNEYKSIEDGVGKPSFFAFYEGAMLIYHFFRQQAQDQIPVFLDEDVRRALVIETKNRRNYALAMDISSSSYNSIARERITRLTEDYEGEENPQSHLANALLAKAHERTDGESEAFLVGAAAILFPMIDLWAEKKEAMQKSAEEQAFARRLKALLDDPDNSELLPGVLQQALDERREKLRRDHSTWRD